MTDTQILGITRQSLALAKEIIQKGGLVAFPTETVYGLGANALNKSAIDSIYTIKGRPRDNPLIVHVYDGFDMGRLCVAEPPYAQKLKKAFLPGPLTMVYKCGGDLAQNVSGKLNTLAVRVPSHEGCQSFLKYIDLPIAAPSANISKHVSPVTSAHVYDDFQGKIPLILEGGRCSLGIESTVLDVTGSIPVILRSGSVTKTMIESVVGVCLEAAAADLKEIKSPGMKYKHYSPTCPTKYFDAAQTDRAAEFYKLCEDKGQKAAIVCDGDAAGFFKGKRVYNLGSSAEQISKNLYYMLRDAESKADIIIGIRLKNKNDVYGGVFSRMEKAFGGSDN